MENEVVQLIERLGLEPHVEGGYFKRTYCSKQVLNSESEQALASSIYYLLTSNHAIGHFHKNSSDILHFHHGKGVIRYYLVSQQGELSTVDMGWDFNKGQVLQLLVPAGFWKASELIEGDAGLISEVVIPEFRFEDMVMATQQDMLEWSDKAQSLLHLIR
jgi:predicted cupin superfamily sugar epimerase